MQPRNATAATLGAGNCIGAAVARRFAAEGFTVFAGRLVREHIRARRGEAALARLQPDQLMRPEARAEAYWSGHQPPRDAWTFEHDVRPSGEKW